MQSDLQNVQSISFNIITIFTILFVSILFLMFMSYLSSTNKISDLNMRLSQMSNERDELLTQISDLNEIRISNNMQKYEIENNFITKQDFNNFVQVFKNELERKERTEIPKRNEIVNKLPVRQYYPPSNHIKEMYPVPVIPGGEFLKRGVISMRNMDYPYQDLTTTYQRVGTLSTIDKTDDYMMTLYRRDIAPERDLYEYKVIDHTNGNNIEIFLNTNVALLRNGDKIIIPGYESKGEFIVNLDRQYSYIRLRPFP